MNLFGKKKEPAKPVPKLKDTMDHLREAIDMLEKREAHLLRESNKCLEAAKESMKKKDKRAAMYHLKKKKQLERQVELNERKRLNLELQIGALQAAADNKLVASAMMHGKETLKAHQIDDDKMAELVDDLNEEMTKVDEVSEALAGPLGTPMDEDELEAELAGLMEEDADLLEELEEAPKPKTRVKKPAAAKEPEVDVLADAPAAPSGRPKPKTAEEEDLAKLESLML